MATTTNYSWTTPDDTDLVKDGASAIRSLGSAIDSTVFTNAGNAVQKSTIDAKGDLLVGTADNTIARLAVGTNGHTLVADSSTSTGLAWAATSSPSYPWTSFTPTVTSQGGTPTTVSAEARYAQIDKIVIYQFKVDITNAGTATGHISIDLPVSHESGSQSSGYCVEYNNTGESGSVIQTSSAPYIRNYSFSTWWANGNKILGTLIYKAA